MGRVRGEGEENGMEMGNRNDILGEDRGDVRGRDRVIMDEGGVERIISE